MLAVLARTTLAATGLIALLSSGSVLAQTAPAAPAVSGGLEEIVVTATRRSERLQDVPISVTAFSQEKLDAQGLRNIDDLSRLSPGLNFFRNGMGSSANYNDENSDIAIRGVDSAAGAATTGIYIDDTPVQSRHIGFGAVTVFPALFDLDRIEVLRGPQGTLFGAGAEGGVVRFITVTPGLNSYTGYVRSEFAVTDHGDPSYELGVGTGGPIIDNVLGFRFSVSYRRDGGWVDRVSYTRAANDFLTPPVYSGTTEKAANYQQTVTARLAFRWQPSENLSFTPAIYFQNLQIHDTAAYWQSLSDPSSEIFRNGNALRNPSADPYYLASVKTDWNLGFAQLAANTAYFSRDQHSTSDYTQYLRATWAFFNNAFQFGTLTNPYPQPGDAGYAPFRDRQDNFYQEVRLASTDKDARLSWNAGVFYSKTNENIPEDIIDPTLEAETGGNVCAVYGIECPNGLIYHGPVDRVVEKQIAAFGELTFKFSEHWKATAGLRLAKDDVEGTVVSGGAFVVTPLSPIPTLVVTSSEKPVTPKFTLDYQPDRDNLLYASAAKGYRSGGVNIPVGTLCDPDLITLGLPVGADGHPHVPDSYTSDSLWSYELGAKNSLLNHRLQINSSIFVVNWKKIIQNVYLPTCGEQFAANLGQVQSKGGDIEVQFKAATPLTVDLTVAYTDARYTRASCAGVLTAQNGVCTGPGNAGAPPVVSEGDRLPGAPWTFLAWAEYATPFASGGKLAYFRFDYQRTTAQTALTPGQNSANALFDTTIPGLPSTKNLSLRAGLRVNGFDFSVFGNNMLNDHPKLFSSRDIAYDATDNLYFGRSVRPRTFGVTATYRY